MGAANIISVTNSWQTSAHWGIFIIQAWVIICLKSVKQMAHTLVDRGRPYDCKKVQWKPSTLQLLLFLLSLCCLLVPFLASLLQPTMRDPTKVSHPIQKQQFENLCCFSQPSANHLLLPCRLDPNQLWKSANHYPTISKVIEHWTLFEKRPTIVQPSQKCFSIQFEKQPTITQPLKKK